MMSVLVIGSVVELVACKLSDNFRIGESILMSDYDSSIGNDSAIVAIALSRLGHSVSIMAFNQVSKAIQKKINSYNINTDLCNISDNKIVTIVIEEKSGQRTFITSKYKYSLPKRFFEDKYSWVYIDLYDEHMGMVDRIIRDNQDFFSKHNVWVNVSSSNYYIKCKLISKYGIEKVLIQVSCRWESVNHIIDNIKRILPSSVIIATCGHKGSVLFKDGNKSFVKPAEVYDYYNYIGAGAFFAAYFIDMYSKNKSLTKAQNEATEKVSYLCSNRHMFLLDAMNDIRSVIDSE